MAAKIPRLIIAGTSSGVGKTTTMVALIGALRKRGLKVACFKCGPDYLDPTYYRLANESQPHNLDPWMMGRDGVTATLLRGSKGADIALIEGMMGLYDGLAPHRDTGSTAQLAKWLQAPVLLVLDASAIARSLAAFALGFAQFDTEVNLAGLWCNRVGGEGHLELLRRTKPCRLVLGGLPRRPDDGFTERHLGLVAAQTETLPKQILQRWAEAAERFGDVDRLMNIAREAPALAWEQDIPAPPKTASQVTIGLAHDAAFSFYYEENLRLLEANGAKLVPFSPIADHSLPQVDGLIFGGGYPEVHAKALSENTAMLQAIRTFAEGGGPIYAECGGYMYLNEAIRTTDGIDYPMVGWFPGKAIMAEQLQAIGYAEAVTCAPSLLGGKGTRLRGHQFRYSHLDDAGSEADPLFRLQRYNGDDQGLEGRIRGRAYGSYFHAHWASNPMVPRALVRFLTRAGG